MSCSHLFSSTTRYTFGFCAFTNTNADAVGERRDYNHTGGARGTVVGTSGGHHAAPWHSRSLMDRATERTHGNKATNDSWRKHNSAASAKTLQSPALPQHTVGAWPSTSPTAAPSLPTMCTLKQCAGTVAGDRSVSTATEVEAVVGVADAARRWVPCCKCRRASS